MAFLFPVHHCFPLKKITAMKNIFFLTLFLLAASWSYGQYLYDASGTQVARVDGNYFLQCFRHADREDGWKLHL